MLRCGRGDRGAFRELYDRRRAGPRLPPATIRGRGRRARAAADVAQAWLVRTVPRRVRREAARGCSGCPQRPARLRPPRSRRRPARGSDAVRPRGHARGAWLDGRRGAGALPATARGVRRASRTSSTTPRWPPARHRPPPRRVTGRGATTLRVPTSVRRRARLTGHRRDMALLVPSVPSPRAADRGGRRALPPTSCGSRGNEHALARGQGRQSPVGRVCSSPPLFEARS